MLEMDEVVEITRTVWQSILGEDEFPAPTETEADDGALLTGFVHLSGAWEGVISVGCSASLALRIAGAMFDLAPDRASGDEVADAIGEVTNMVGGNIKALLPGPSKISLPAVADRGVRIPGSELVLAQSFVYRGDRLRVSILSKSQSSRSAWKEDIS